MSAPTSSSADVTRLTSEVKAAGEAVKALKTKQVKGPELTAAIEQLQKLKAELAAATPAAAPTPSTSPAEMDSKTFRSALEDLLTRRFFYLPAYEIYGGVKGLYDFGPMGCAIKTNLIAAWRRHFILEEGMLEVDCAAMTPHVVLKTSGHVDKFTDFMVKDDSNGECYRADKLLEEHIDKVLTDPKHPVSADRVPELQQMRTQAGAMSRDELMKAFAALSIVSPSSQGPLSEPFPFNLMFETQIGPTGKFIGYLRPETAQGIFVNYRRLLEFNNGKMPFACAQIGLAFRNEIAPRQGLLRVREFTLAEIEHFVQPDKKQHPKFSLVAQVELSLLPRAAQTGEDVLEKVKVGDAVQRGLINNETLGYYMARTHLFMLHIGVDKERIRFRQHLSTEMAHYAADCWDCELKGTYGWIETVGHADRAAYDLRVHTEKSKVELVAQETFEQPRMMEVATVKPNHALIGKTFGKQQNHKLLLDYLKDLEKDKALELQAKLAEGPYTVTVSDGATFELQPSMVDVKLETKKISTIKYIPSVIEPSFGIGRILYHLLEHSFHVRPTAEAAATPASERTAATPDTKILRAYLSLPPHMAPVKVALLPLSGQPQFVPLINRLQRLFTASNVSSKSDSSGNSIGRRYARSDEVGIPFAVTVDFDSVKDNTVTLRERDSTQQVRLSVSEVVDVVTRLCRETAGGGEEEGDTEEEKALQQRRYITWPQVYSTFPQIIRSEADDS